jgi:hypothetical protein
MRKRITIWVICFVALIAWTGLTFAQTEKPAAIKTIKLPSGEEIFDISGEWDASVECYGPWEEYGSYPQQTRITQDGTSFSGVRMIDDPNNQKGSPSIRGDLSKDGFKLVYIVATRGAINADGKISGDGNKIVVDDS